jgi:hypothetical protein
MRANANARAGLASVIVPCANGPPWDEYKRRRRAFWIAYLLSPLWLFPLAMVEELFAARGVDAQNPVSVVAVVLPPLICLAVLYLRWLFWPCPQCGKPFRVGWFVRLGLPRWCANCRLPMWQVPGKGKPSETLLLSRHPVD